MKYLPSAALLLAAGALAAPLDEAWDKRQAPSAPSSSAPPGTTVPNSPSPPVATTVLNTTSTGKFQWQIYKSCSASDKAQIQLAFAQSKWLSDAINSWVPTGKFQEAFDMYLGPDSSYPGNLFGYYNYRKIISNNIKRQQALYQGQAYANSNLYVYCNEDSRWWSGCTKGGQGAVIAYEEESDVFNNWYITFCPNFYTPSAYVEPLDQSLAATRSRQRNAGILDSYANSQAGTFFHEMFHMSKLVTDPQALDYAYSPQNVYDQAKNKGTSWAYVNADAYHMAAAAILGQQQFGLSQPPVPGIYYNIKDTSSSPSNFTSFLNDTIINLTVSDFAPQGMTNASTFAVNTDYWEIQSLTYSSLSTISTPSATSSLPVAASNLPNTVGSASDIPVTAPATPTPTP